MTSAREQEIARYIEQVGQALADLPPATREELLEDLPAHLVEVCAESAEPLVDRLGPPEVYAAELRAAAGLATVSRRAKLDERVNAVLANVRHRLHSNDVRLGSVIGYDRLSDFLRLLRPGWWLLRGYLVALLIGLLASDPPPGLLPRLGNSELGGALLLAVTVLGSIWFGRRTGRLPRWPMRAVGLTNVALMLFGLILLIDLDGQARRAPYDYQPAYSDQFSHVRDVYVYDQQGRLLEGVRLFDQNGEPIRLGHPWCPEADVFQQDGDSWSYRTEPVDPVRLPYPYCPQRAPFRFAEPTVEPTVGPTPPEPSASAPTRPVG